MLGGRRGQVPCDTKRKRLGALIEDEERAAEVFRLSAEWVATELGVRAG